MTGCRARHTRTFISTSPKSYYDKVSGTISKELKKENTTTTTTTTVTTIKVKKCWVSISLF